MFAFDQKTHLLKNIMCEIWIEAV